MQKYSLLQSLYQFWRKDFFNDLILFWKRRPIIYILFFSTYIGFLSLPHQINQWNDFINTYKPIINQIPDIIISKNKLNANKIIKLNHYVTGKELIVVDTTQKLKIEKKKQFTVFVDQDDIYLRGIDSSIRPLNIRELLPNTTMILSDILLTGWKINVIIYILNLIFSILLPYLIYCLFFSLLYYLFHREITFKIFFTLSIFNLYPVILTTALGVYGADQFFMIVGLGLFMLMNFNLRKNLFLILKKK